MRFFLKFIPQNAKVRILQGKLSGKKWIKGSGVNGYWLGTYELEGQKVFIENLKSGDIIFDIGANVGFYSLLAAELAGEESRVFSFEPLEENFNYLKKHILINNYRNIFLFKEAVADKNDFGFFKKEKSSAMGHLGDGNIKVETISLDEWIKNGKLPFPNFLKIDVEGAEFSVLKGAQNLLKEKHPIIFLSIHGDLLREKCFNFLLSSGYDLFPIKKEGLNKANEILAKFKLK